MTQKGAGKTSDKVVEMVGEREGEGEEEIPLH